MTRHTVDIGVLQELVLDAFLMRHGISHLYGGRLMELGIGGGRTSFVRWIAQKVVVGRDPRRMDEDPDHHGGLGVWSDAMDLCLQNGIRFEPSR